MPAKASERSAEVDDPRVYFAAERTLLAWIRTGLALMGFGFIVARFGLFLRELAAVHPERPAQGTSFSLALGLALVVLGVVVTALAAARHARYMSRLRAGLVDVPGSTSLVTALALILSLLGLAIAVLLVFGVR
jgi:putative membrane protein